MTAAQTVPVARENIYAAAQTLDFLYREFQDTKAELRLFLSEYYEKIGSYLSRLSTEHAKPSASASPALRLPLTDAALPTADPTASLEHPQAQARELYRLLVRKFHPDCQREIKDPELIKEITSAYQQGRIGSLWKIIFDQEWPEISTLPMPIRQNFLLHYQTQLTRATEVMERELGALMQSPEYELQQRVFAARLRGEDLLDRIASHMKEEVTRLQRRQAYVQIRHQLAEEAVWA